jgi:transcriptional regulator with XRE-family HTH domain
MASQRPRHPGAPPACLRREEVATLAGISTDYYLRLEQGRDRNPSPQVLSALAPAIRPGANRLRSLFLDAAERDLYPDWEQASASMVPSFRASIGTDTDDPRIAQLVGELSLASESFRRLWARHDVKALAGGTAVIRHPVVGPLELSREKLPIGDSGGQLLVIYHAAAGSASADALARLATLAEPPGQSSASGAV